MSLYFLCKYFLSFVPSVRMFPLLIIEFVPFKNITVSMKEYVKHNNTLRLNIEIKCILICKIYYHSKIYCGLDMNLVQKTKKLALICLLILLYLMH